MRTGITDSEFLPHDQSKTKKQLMTKKYADFSAVCNWMELKMSEGWAVKFRLESVG